MVRQWTLLVMVLVCMLGQIVVHIVHGTLVLVVVVVHRVKDFIIIKGKDKFMNLK